jgi:hypothetical protein
MLARAIRRLYVEAYLGSIIAISRGCKAVTLRCRRPHVCDSADASTNSSP